MNTENNNTTPQFLKKCILTIPPKISPHKPATNGQFPLAALVFFTRERRGLGGCTCHKTLATHLKNHPYLKHHGSRQKYPLRPLRLGEKYPPKMGCMGHQITTINYYK